MIKIDKQIRNKNLDFLITIGITNKNHLNILSQYHELKFFRIIIFILSVISLLTTTIPYVFFAALVYIILEIFIYRYDLFLRKKYLIKRINNYLENEVIEEKIE